MIKPSSHLQWRKSQQCGSSSCVEVATADDQFFVRDSKNPEVEPLSFSRSEWQAFVTGVREGDFDLA
ncbi:DUF397 domain-containing protein [Micromonosporaceae bacterium Da 78-11]